MFYYLALSIAEKYNVYGIMFAENVTVSAPSVPHHKMIYRLAATASCGLDAAKGLPPPDFSAGAPPLA